MAKRKTAAEKKAEAENINLQEQDTSEGLDPRGAVVPTPDTSVEQVYGTSHPKSAEFVPEAQVAINENSPRYSDEELDMFKQNLVEARQEAFEELAMLKDRLEDLTNYDFAEESMIYSMHMAEQGSEAMEKEKTYAQIQRINEYIQKLDHALLRIADKTYGVCRVCNILIAKERLLAVPITTLSASYKIHQRCPEDGIDRIEPVNNSANS